MLIYFNFSHNVLLSAFKGHEVNAQKLLEPYLPRGEADQFGYKEGGSLYAYGKWLLCLWLW